MKFLKKFLVVWVCLMMTAPLLCTAVIAEEMQADVIKKAWITKGDGSPFAEGEKIGAWAPFRLYAEYELPDNTLKEGDTTTLTLPVGFDTAPPDYFEIKDGNEVIATATMHNENPAKIILKYTKYVEEHSGVKGTFYFNVSVNAEKTEKSGKYPITLTVNGKVIPAGEVNYNAPQFKNSQFSKVGWMTNNKTEGKYDIRINQDNVILVNAKLVDTLLSDNVSFIEDSIEIWNGKWENYGSYVVLGGKKNITQELKDAGKINFDGKKLTIDIGDYPESNEKRGFQILYRVKLGYEPVAGEIIRNKANLTYDGYNTDKYGSYVIKDAGGTGEGYVFKIKVQKTGDDNAPLAGAKFDVIRVRNNQKVGEITTGQDGSGVIEKLLRDEYKLVETEAPEGYQKLEGPITVNPDNFGENKIAVMNVVNKKYTAEGSWVPTATKTLTGRTLVDGEFEFELKEDRNVLQTVKNKANGTIPFAAINYTLADVGEHTYTITEKNTSLPGVTYDDMTVTYKVKVADKGDGTLDVTVTQDPADKEFSNTYSATGSWKPAVTKQLSGRPLLDDEFEFELIEDRTYFYRATGDFRLLQTVKNKADGTIPFSAINYTMDDIGEHTYIIKEKEGNLPGVIHYDSMVVIYKVKVADKGDGTLEVTITKDPADKEFNNIYEASGNWTPTATKKLTGRTLADGEFEFELKEDSNVLQTVKNKADGTIPFAAIEYTVDDIGEHTYTITEKNTSLPGVTYDSMTVTYKVKVKDNRDGTLATTVTEVSNDTEFNNTYGATGSWKPAVTKQLSGRPLLDDEFEFELKENGDILQTVKNKANGTIPFATINYTVDDIGDHTYVITEKAGTVPGVTYDNMRAIYKVHVSDKGDGTLKVTVGGVPSDTEFNNVYEATGSWKPTVTKKLIGRELVDGEFEFELRENNDPIQIARNKVDGAIPFEAINYTLADVGEHTYVIREKVGTESDITYDRMEVTYTVRVMDKGDGTLETTVTRTPSDTEFNNSYTSEPLVPKTSDNSNIKLYAILLGLFGVASILIGYKCRKYSN